MQPIISNPSKGGIAKLVIVTSRFPFPVVSGERLRIFNLLQQLAREYDVYLVSLGSPSASEVSALVAQTRIAGVHTVRRSLVKSLLGVLRALISRRSLQVGYFRSSALAKVLQPVTADASVVIYHLVRTSYLHRKGEPFLAVLEMCDEDSARMEQLARCAPVWSIWRWIGKYEGRRALENELREVPRFDLVTLHTARDAARLRFRPGQLLISTQGVDLDRYPYTPPTSRLDANIAVIGRVDYFPNLSSIEWFATRVLPLLPPEINLKVVGECSQKVRHRLLKHPRVIVTGRVQSIAEACNDCFAAVAPMIIATGVQNKVLEYFALGLPTIITETVSHGLMSTASNCYRLAHSPLDWQASLLEMRTHPSRFLSMCENARNYVEHTHSWRAIGDEYLAALRSKRLTGEQAMR
jgi:glycosyltransferase involved in cell wall biosynthesis